MIQSAINVKIPQPVKNAIKQAGDTYGIKQNTLIIDLLMNSAPRNIIPQEFIVRSRIHDLLKVDAPINAVIPYAASILGLSFNNYTVKDRMGKEFKISPYPEHGKMFIILMLESLYDVYRRLL